MQRKRRQQMQRQCDKAFSVMSTKTPKKNDNKVSKRKTCNWWERVKRGGDSEVAILAFPEEGEIGKNTRYSNLWMQRYTDTRTLTHLLHASRGFSSTFRLFVFHFWDRRPYANKTEATSRFWLRSWHSEFKCYPRRLRLHNCHDSTAIIEPSKCFSCYMSVGFYYG